MRGVAIEKPNDFPVNMRQYKCARPILNYFDNTLFC